MVTEVNVLMRKHVAARAATFPATRDIVERRWASAVHLSGRGPGGSPPDQFESFFFTVVHFTDFDPEWPLATHWPYAIKGLRGSMQRSQTKFAELCGLGKATVERWEVGKAAPLRGDALHLLTLVRPHLGNPVEAGQALNLAAAAILPHLTRPTATYDGDYLAGMLNSGKHDHTDLASHVIEALVSSRILLPIEHTGNELTDTYIPLAGRIHQGSDLPHWAHQLVDDIDSASEPDRQLVLDLARRFATRA